MHHLQEYFLQRGLPPTEESHARIMRITINMNTMWNTLSQPIIPAIGPIQPPPSLFGTLIAAYQVNGWLLPCLECETVHD